MLRMWQPRAFAAELSENDAAIEENGVAHVSSHGADEGDVIIIGSVDAIDAPDETKFNYPKKRTKRKYSKFQDSDGDKNEGISTGFLFLYTTPIGSIHLSLQM